MVNIKSSKLSAIKLLDEDNNLVSDFKKNANTFNNHFSSIGYTVAQKIRTAPGHFKDYFNKKDTNGNLYINPSNSSFFLAPCVPMEIEKLIENLNIKK